MTATDELRKMLDSHGVEVLLHKPVTKAELARENAELRELCGFVLMFTTMTDGCGDTCPYSCNNCQNECYFRKRARELGVEVDK